HSGASMPCLHDRAKLLKLAFAYQAPHRRCYQEDLECQHPAVAVGARDQPLRYYALDHRRELDPYLLLLMRGKRLGYSVDGLNCRIGMERCKCEMTRLSKGYGSLYGVRIAHFADKDNIGVLTHYVL